MTPLLQVTESRFCRLIRYTKLNWRDYYYCIMIWWSKFHQKKIAMFTGTQWNQNLSLSKHTIHTYKMKLMQSMNRHLQIYKIYLLYYNSKHFVSITCWKKESVAVAHLSYWPNWCPLNQNLLCSLQKDFVKSNKIMTLNILSFGTDIIVPKRNGMICLHVGKKRKYAEISAIFPFRDKLLFWRLHKISNPV